CFVWLAGESHCGGRGRLPSRSCRGRLSRIQHVGAAHSRVGLRLCLAPRPLFGLDRPNARGMTPVRETSITVNSRKYDGTVRRSWAGEVVATSDSAIDLVGVFDGSVDHPDLGRIE